MRTFPFSLSARLALLNADKSSMPCSVHSRTYDNVRQCRHCTRFCCASCTSKHLNRATLRFKCFLVIVVAVVVWVVYVCVCVFFCVWGVSGCSFFVIVRRKMPSATWNCCTFQAHIQLACPCMLHAVIQFSPLYLLLVLLSFIIICLRIERVPVVAIVVVAEYHVLKITVTIIHDDF